MKVSVLITTYNREKYIAQALESVLKQNVNFEYEIIVGEDNSTDNTRKILLTYIKEFPQKIRVLLHAINIKASKNLYSIFQISQGEYIALLDSDDYWTSQFKLQRQADFMDVNPEYSICFHDSKHFYQDESKDNWFVSLPRNSNTFNIQDLRRPFIPTSSTMLRRNVLKDLPSWYSESRSLEWPLHIIFSQFGKIGYIREVMSATRIHKDGAWNGLSLIEQYKKAIHQQELTYKNVPLLRKSLRIELCELYFKLANETFCNGNIKESRAALVKSFTKSVRHPHIRINDRIKLFLKVFMPNLFLLLLNFKKRLSNV